MATIATSTSAFATRNGSQRKVFYDTTNNVLWAFYFDGTNIDYYYSTNNGSSWTSSSTITGTTLSDDFSVWYDGSTSIYVVYNDAGAVKAIKGTTASSSISFGSSTTAAASTQSDVNISQDTSGYIWLCYNNKPITSPFGSFYVIRATSANSISAWNTATELLGLSGLGTHPAQGIILPLGSQNMYVIFYVDNFSGGTDYLYGSLFNGTSWASAASIFQLSSGTLASGREGIVSGISNTSANTIDILFTDTQDATGSQGEIWYAHYASSAWGSEANLSSNTANDMPSLTIDSSGNLWAFYIRSNVIYYQEHTGGSWGSETALVSTGTNAQFTTPSTVPSAISVSGTYVNGTSSPYNVIYYTSTATIPTYFEHNTVYQPVIIKPDLTSLSFQTFPFTSATHFEHNNISQPINIVPTFTYLAFQAYQFPTPVIKPPQGNVYFVGNRAPQPINNIGITMY